MRLSNAASVGGLVCEALLAVRQRVRPNSSVEARPNGKPTRPLPGCAYHPSSGRVASPSAPPHLER